MYNSSSDGYSPANVQQHNNPSTSTLLYIAPHPSLARSPEKPCHGRGHDHDPGDPRDSMSTSDSTAVAAFWS